MAANFSNAFNHLLDTLLNLYMAALILRILLQWLRAEFHNPFSQFIWRVTNPPVLTLARFVPKWRRLDLAACIVLLLLSLLTIYAGAWMWRRPLELGDALWWALLKLLWVAINLYTLTLVVQWLLVWFGPGISSPAGSVLYVINEPLLRPVRRRIPPVSGFDLSPLIVMLALQFVMQLLGLPSWFQ
ncbi:MAG TPA: YggT family protein [Nevskiaceae bacterium]|nr:YggT family protein [Nevskiaceae bacterium]